MRGITPSIVADSGFVIDVDRPRDLTRLLPLGPDTQTGIFLERSGIAGRLPAAVETQRTGD